MKILQLGKFYPVKGGVEKVMYDLTRGISERGVNCDMMCAVTESHPKVIDLNSWGKLYCCRALPKLAATTLSAEMPFRLREVCGHYDIIHIHHPDPMACAALRFSGFKGKVVLHWHSDVVKQKTLLRFYTPLQNWLINRADLIVGTTPVYVKESAFLNDVQHKVTSLPIGVEKLSPHPKDVERIREEFSGKKIIFSLGRLVHYKGHRFLIDAARLLGNDYVVFIAGEGPLRNELQSLIDDNGLSGRVFLPGSISEAEKTSYFGACDVFCLSSITKAEAFGIVQIEAMSCGRPVVATNIPGSGVSWINKHEETGLNVDPESGGALASAIETICDNEELGIKYSENARRRYANYFTMDKMITDCFKIYEMLL